MRNLIKDNLKILDSLRGFAAIYVLIHHARWLLWEGYENGYLRHPADYSFFHKVLMYFFSAFKFGNEAVLFFFVLSGFVIHWSVSRRLDKNNGQFNVTDYLIKRIRRIYPPLLIALVLTYILDKTGTWLHFPVYFSNTPYPAINEQIHSDLSFSTLLGNLFFVQKIYTPVWGSDGALWSLMYEWWFYMLYIPLLFLFRKNKYITTLTLLLVWCLNVAYGAVLPLLIYKVLTLFIIWFTGMLLADMLLYKSINIKAALLYLFFMVAGAYAGKSNELQFQIILTVFIVSFIYLILTTGMFDFLKRFEKTGAFSYTLYVVHMPVIFFMSGFVMKSNNGFLPSHFLYVALGIIIALILGWYLHLIGEKPFTKK